MNFINKQWRRWLSHDNKRTHAKLISRFLHVVESEWSTLTHGGMSRITRKPSSMTNDGARYILLPRPQLTAAQDLFLIQKVLILSCLLLLPPYLLYYSWFNHCQRTLYCVFFENKPVDELMIESFLSPAIGLEFFNKFRTAHTNIFSYHYRRHNKTSV